MMEWTSERSMPTLPIADLATRFPRIDAEYASTFPEFNDPETTDQLLERCKNAILQIVNRFKNYNIIIVTHAAPLVALSRGLLGDPGLLVRTGTCSITKITCKKSHQNVQNLDKDGNHEVEIVETKLENLEIEDSNFSKSKNVNPENLDISTKDLENLDRSIPDLENMVLVEKTCFWELEINGDASHLSKGEQNHWTFTRK